MIEFINSEDESVLLDREHPVEHFSYLHFLLHLHEEGRELEFLVDWTQFPFNTGTDEFKQELVQVLFQTSILLSDTLQHLRLLFEPTELLRLLFKESHLYVPNQLQNVLHSPVYFRREAFREGLLSVVVSASILRPKSECLLDLEIVSEDVSHERTVVDEVRVVLLKEHVEVVVGSPQIECLWKGKYQSVGRRLGLRRAFNEKKRNDDDIDKEKEG